MTNSPGVNREPQSEPPSKRPRRHERLSVRVSAEQKALFDRAAALEGRSLTDFVIGSAQAATSATIRQHAVITVTARDSAVFAEALTNPPLPNERLREAARRYRDLVAE